MVADRPTRARGPAADAGACADDLAVALDTITELETELYGTPVAWTDDVPPDYRPEAVEARVREVFRDCDVGGEFLGVDCDEKPCYAVATTTDTMSLYNEIVDCPIWSEAWGNGTGVSSRNVDCGDGVVRRLLLVSPGDHRVTDEEFEANFARASAPEHRAVNENYAKRTKVRADAAEVRLCASVAAGQR